MLDLIKESFKDMQGFKSLHEPPREEIVDLVKQWPADIKRQGWVLLIPAIMLGSFIVFIAYTIMHGH